MLKQRVVVAAPDRVWPLVSEQEELTEWCALAERIEVIEVKGRGGDSGSWPVGEAPTRSGSNRLWRCACFGSRQVANRMEESLDSLEKILSG